MSSSLSREEVLDALRTVKFPGFSRDIVSFGFVKHVAVEDRNNVAVTLLVRTNNPEHAQQIKDESEAALRSIPSVGSISLRIDIESPPQTQVAPQPTATTAEPVPGVKHIIAVASGKGGVGKSTISANLAAALQTTGLQVGLCDCDIHGPSVGLMLGTRADSLAQEDDGTIIPPQAYGLKLMSMAFLLGENNPAALRGPMVNRYMLAFLKQTAWGPLDILVLDLPPGTGDIQITIGQSIAISGAILVTTPQEVALIDVRRAASMFNKLNVPVLGLVENMSYFRCPSDGKRYDIFGFGGGEREAKRLQIPLLGQVPIEIEAREAGDRGKPIVLANQENPASVEFIKVARKIRESLQI